MDAQLIQTVAVYALPVLFGITLHEAAHAYAAHYFGDDTAKKMGRMSLNPARHIDWLGTVLVPLLLYFSTSGGFLFGYAKPVPVRFGRLRDPRKHGMWVSLAGPASNFVMAFGFALLSLVLHGLGVQEDFFLRMAMGGVTVNLVLCAFNLLPLPPLDGGRVLLFLLPPQWALRLIKIEPYGFWIVMGLAVSGLIGPLWLRPMMQLLDGIIDFILFPLYSIVS